MPSKPTRVSEEMLEELQALGRVMGCSPGELLERAWRAYRDTEQFEADFNAARQAFAVGDLESIKRLLAERRGERARSRIKRIGELRQE